MNDTASQASQKKKRPYFLGLRLGLIPLVVFLLDFLQFSAALTSFLLTSSLALYLVSLIAMMICLSIQKTRFVGYGLLTTVLVSPVVAFIFVLVYVLKQNLLL